MKTHYLNYIGISIENYIMNLKKYLPKSVMESQTMKRLHIYLGFPIRVSLLKLIGPRRDGRTIKKCMVNNHQILIDIEDINELGRAKSYMTKEPETLTWIETYFQPKDVFYDVGANIGQYSLYAAAYLKGDCTIYSFEPAFHTYAKLNWNIYLNNFESSITAYCIAISDRQQLNSFYVVDMHKGSSGHSFKVMENYEKNPLMSRHDQGMVGISIDELQKTWGLKTPNHIKIDVDGIEGLIIEGAVETLKSPKLKTVLIEITHIKGTDDCSSIINTFLNSGFVLAAKGGKTESEKSMTINYIFVKS